MVVRLWVIRYIISSRLMMKPIDAFTHWVTLALFNEPRAGRRIYNRAVIVAVALLAVLLAGSLAYYKVYIVSTESVYARREVLARAAATAVNERLERVVESLTSITLRPEVPGLADRGEWEKIIDMAATLKPFLDPFVERIALVDPDGNGKAAFPVLDGWEGKNFAHRDWYQGTMRVGGPYVSEIYRRVSRPEGNVVAIAVPIEAENHRLVGILIAQVLPERLTVWASELAAGPGGVTYLVDQHGKVVTHPNLNPQQEPPNISDLEFIRRVVSGATGLAEVNDPLTKEPAVVAYTPVPRYGWGVIVSQRGVEAFSARSYNLGLVVWIFGSLAVFIVIYIFLLLSVVTHACAIHPGPERHTL